MAHLAGLLSATSTPSSVAERLGPPSQPTAHPLPPAVSKAGAFRTASGPPPLSSAAWAWWPGHRRPPSAPAGDAPTPSSPHYVPFWSPSTLPTPPEVKTATDYEDDFLLRESPTTVRRSCKSMPPLEAGAQEEPWRRRPCASEPPPTLILKLPPGRGKRASAPQTSGPRTPAKGLPPPPPPPPAKQRLPPPPPSPPSVSLVTPPRSAPAPFDFSKRLPAPPPPPHGAPSLPLSPPLSPPPPPTPPPTPTAAAGQARRGRSRALSQALQEAMEQVLDEEGGASEATPLLTAPPPPPPPPATPLEPRVLVTPPVLPPPPAFQSSPSTKSKVSFNISRTSSTASSRPSGYLDSVDALGIELPTPAAVGGHTARDANSTDTDLIFLESIARRENPERYNQGKLSLAVQLSEECERAQNKEAWELADLLRKPHVKAVLGTHDVVTGQTQEPDVLLEFQQPEILRNMDNSEIRLVAIRRSQNEPLGMTVQVDENGNLLIARILAGGIIERQGTLNVGDFILEVNGYPVDSPEELQERIAYSKESITFKVAPAKEENNQTSNEYTTNVAKQNGVNSVCFMRALFNYNPMEDTLLPCKEIGLEFQHGDILQIVNQDDPNWWQAKRVGWNGPAGLIPSQELEERRKAFVAPDADYVHKIGMCGTRVSKKKKKIKYQSKSNNDYDKAELLLYEEVTRMPPFKRRTLALVGSQGVGRRTLKNRLINSNVDKFGTIIPYTSRPQRDYEDNGKCYWFVDRETIESDIRNHKYLEYGEHKGHIYGTTLDSIREVINEGKMCVLDCSPAALKVLHNSSEFMPYVIFIAAPGMEQLKSLHNYGRGSRNMMFDRQSSIRFSSQRARTLQSLQTMFEEEDLLRMVEESACLQRTYEKYIDYVIVNEDHDETFRKVVQQLETLSSEHQWVPVNWVY